MRTLRTLVLCGVSVALLAGPATGHPAYAIAVDGAGGVWFLDAPSRRLLRMAPDGSHRVVVDFTALGVRTDPHGLALDRDGRAYVAETYGRRIWVVSRDGVLRLHTWCAREDDGRGAVQDLALGPGGGLHLLRRKEAAGQETRYGLERLEADGRTTRLLEIGADEVDLYASCLALDATGRAWWSAGTRLLRQSGIGVQVVAGGAQGGHADGNGPTARFARCWGLAPRNDGALLVADGAGRRLRLVSPEGAVTTLAGSGAQGGADGPALEATFEHLDHVAVGPAGSIYLSESVAAPWRHRVRVLENGVVRTLGTVAMGTRGPERPLRTLDDFRRISRENLARRSVLDLARMHAVKDWPTSLWVERSHENARADPTDAPLFLAGVESLEPDEARALAAYEGSRNFLPDLRALDLVTAGELARARGDLYLDGLTRVEEDLASVLARMRGRLLALRAVTALDAPTARILAAREGSLWLSGLERLDPETARELSAWKGWGEMVLLSLGIRTLDVQTARALTPLKGWGLALDRLEALSPEVAAVLGALDIPYLSLGGLESIPLGTAHAISRWKRKFLTLDGLREASPELRALIERGCEAVSWRGLTAPR